MCTGAQAPSPKGRRTEGRTDFSRTQTECWTCPFPPQGYTYINLSTIKSILIHDPGSKRTREWWERWRGGVGRLRCLLRREGARCQPRPRDWHFNKRLLQCPVWYNNRVTPLLVSSFLPEPRGPSALSCYLPSSPRQLSLSAVEGRTPGKGPKRAPRRHLLDPRAHDPFNIQMPC